MKRKYLIVVTVFCIAVLSFAQTSENKLDLPESFVVARVNSIPVTAKFLDIECNLPLTLLKMKQTNLNFYDVLLGTEEGYDFLVLYKKLMLEKIIDSIVLFEYSKEMGVVLNDYEISEYVSKYLEEILISNDLSKEDFTNYLLTQGYDTLEDYEIHLRFQRKIALASMGLMEKTVSDVYVGEEEIMEYLNLNTANEVTTSDKKNISVHLAHILLENQSDALAVLDSISRYGFELSAQQYSKDELTKYNGGDLGWIQYGFFPQFDVAFDSKAGDVIGPISTQLGFHILKVVEFRGIDNSDSAEREEAIAQIKAQKKFDLWEDWIKTDFQEIKKRYSIENNF